MPLQPFGPDREPVALEVHELETLGADLLATARIVFGNDIEDYDTEWCNSTVNLDDERVAELTLNKEFSKRLGMYCIVGYELSLSKSEDYEPNRLLELIHTSTFEYYPSENCAKKSNVWHLHDPERSVFIRMAHPPEPSNRRNLKANAIIKDITSGRGSAFNTFDREELYDGLKAFGWVNY